MKKISFLQFLSSPYQKKVKNSFSDNFEASGLPHGSFEALWAKDKWEQLKSANFFSSKLGSRPPLELVYPGSGLLKSYFSGPWIWVLSC